MLKGGLKEGSPGRAPPISGQNSSEGPQREKPERNQCLFSVVVIELRLAGKNAKKKDAEAARRLSLLVWILWDFEKKKGEVQK